MGSRYPRVLCIAAGCVLGTTIAVNVFGQTPTIREFRKEKTFPTTQPDIPPLPPLATATVRLTGFPQLGGDFDNSLPVSVQFLAERINLGGYLVMDQQSLAYIGLVPKVSSVQTIPSGRYRVRLNVSNVGAPATVTLRSGALTRQCVMQVRLGYNNLQSCDLVVDSPSGAPFQVSATMSGVQVTLSGVQVFKEQ